MKYHISILLTVILAGSVGCKKPATSGNSGLVSPTDMHKTGKSAPRISTRDLDETETLMRSATSANELRASLSNDYGPGLTLAQSSALERTIWTINEGVCVTIYSWGGIPMSAELRKEGSNIKTIQYKSQPEAEKELQQVISSRESAGE